MTSFALFPTYSGASPELSRNQYGWLGAQIFENECNSRPGCLTSWNEGEDFPSLGIGHFIWYRTNQQEIYEETFPALLGFLQQHGTTLPAWLEPPLQADNPWLDRASFNAAQQANAMRELRGLLESTTDLQAQFIVERFNREQEAIVASFPAEQQQLVRSVMQEIASLHPPLGQYALIDYLHFKGSGLNANERYQDQGWGLKQVIAELIGRQVSLNSFVLSAKTVLDRRIENAPPARSESRWQRGWHKRLETYLPSP